MTNSIKEFWDYFEENKFIFHILNEVEKAVQREKIAHLHQLINVFHPHIGFLIKLEKVIPELIITAYGNPYMFKSVELLVKFAPKIDCWKITAFLQPSTAQSQFEAGTDQPFYHHGIKLKISQMRFIAFPTENNPCLISIDLYIPIKATLENQNIIRGAVYIILEHLLGEKAFANQINYIHIHELKKLEESRTFPLWFLLEHINNFKFDVF